MKEIICLSRYLLSPCERHINAVNKVFRYLQNSLSNNPGRVSFDPDCVPADYQVLGGSTR